LPSGKELYHKLYLVFEFLLKANANSPVVVVPSVVEVVVPVRIEGTKRARQTPRMIQSLQFPYYTTLRVKL